MEMIEDLALKGYDILVSYHAKDRNFVVAVNLEAQTIIESSDDLEEALRKVNEQLFYCGAV